MKEKKGNKGEKMIVVCATDEGYAPYLSAMLGSLSASLPDGVRAEVTVMHAGLSDNALRGLLASSDEGMSVRALDASDMIAPYRERMYSVGYLSPAMYYRALIPRLFSGRVVYLDSDLAVLGDLSELYFADMGESYALGVPNPMHPRMRSYVLGLGLSPEKYVNSGVLLLDCDKLSAMDFTERFFELLGRMGELRFPDQDAINILLSDRLGYLPPEWNYLWHMERLGGADDPGLRMPPAELARYTAIYDRARVIHYTGDMKPWVHDAFRGAEHFLAFAERCPMRDEIARRRAEALKNEERIKLLFLDVRGGRMTLTAAHILPRALPKKRISYTLHSEEHIPEISLERDSTSRGISMLWRCFEIELPASVPNEGYALRFFLDGREVLFEYEKFFPLNGIPESYLATRGMIMRREGRVLRIEPYSGKRRLSLELGYLRALARERSAQALKYLVLRVAYPLIRRILPKRVWLISDRPEVAGDNGEALFLYLCKHAPRGVRPYFVIRRSSPDFRRLGKQGRVIAAGSLYHKLISLVCEVKAVSQTDGELYFPIDPRLVKDILWEQVRVFLQHGVTKDDISSAYSRFAHGFDLFITAAYPEYFSIVENPRYGLDTSRVALTGFPRHDLLSSSEERVILVAPTWRSYLLPRGEADVELFASSRYFSAWQSLLSDGALPDIAEKYGYRVVFLPHRNTRPYLSVFDGISGNVEIADGSYAEEISRASLMITDYSSVAFEMAYLAKPVLYYLFDEGEFFSRHTCRAGYFDPRRDGFGEASLDEAGLLSAAERILSAGGEASRLAGERAEGFFAYRGGGNSARVAEAVERAVSEKKSKP